MNTMGLFLRAFGDDTEEISSPLMHKLFLTEFKFYYLDHRLLILYLCCSCEKYFQCEYLSFEAIDLRTFDMQLTICLGRYTLNIWDVGGQKTIRSYWRNYFEQTDGLVWVVDSSDLRRLDDCKLELDNLLKEEVRNPPFLNRQLKYVITT